MIKTRGFLLSGVECISGSRNIGVRFFVMKNLKGFRVVLIKFFITALVLVNESTHIDAQCHRCSVDRNETFRVFIATSSLISKCAQIYIIIINIKADNICVYYILIINIYLSTFILNIYIYCFHTFR